MIHGHFGKSQRRGVRAPGFLRTDCIPSRPKHGLRYVSTSGQNTSITGNANGFGGVSPRADDFMTDIAVTVRGFFVAKAETFPPPEGKTRYSYYLEHDYSPPHILNGTRKPQGAEVRTVTERSDPPPPLPTQGPPSVIVYRPKKRAAADWYLTY